MTHKIWIAISLTGIGLLLLAAVTANRGAEIIGVSFERMDLVPLGFTLLGFLVLLTGLSIPYDEKTKSTKQKIKDKDERVITIRRSAAEATFIYGAIAIPLALLGLAMFGYMNHVSFFTLYIICTIGAGVYGMTYLRMKRAY
ncbi:hypothetical protein ACFO4L_11295 [Bacillus daqingensis]|uniref:DUF2178 domain-containing protein n=1 Tax=Bacillus daqingensis TaxID=872396 RepID=A0ABV9P018_9BACI